MATTNNNNQISVLFAKMLLPLCCVHIGVYIIVLVALYFGRVEMLPRVIVGGMVLLVGVLLLMHCLVICLFRNHVYDCWEKSFHLTDELDFKVKALDRKVCWLIFNKNKQGSWKRDLTREGIEPNPGPLPMFVDSMLEVDELLGKIRVLVPETCNYFEKIRNGLMERSELIDLEAPYASDWLQWISDLISLREEIQGHLRDLTREGVEPNPGPDFVELMSQFVIMSVFYAHISYILPNPAISMVNKELRQVYLDVRKMFSCLTLSSLVDGYKLNRSHETVYALDMIGRNELIVDGQIVTGYIRTLRLNQLTFMSPYKSMEKCFDCGTWDSYIVGDGVMRAQKTILFKKGGFVSRPKTCFKNLAEGMAASSMVEAGFSSEVITLCRTCFRDVRRKAYRLIALVGRLIGGIRFNEYHSITQGRFYICDDEPELLCQFEDIGSPAMYCLLYHGSGSSFIERNHRVAGLRSLPISRWIKEDELIVKVQHNVLVYPVEFVTLEERMFCHLFSDPMLYLDVQNEAWVESAAVMMPLLLRRVWGRMYQLGFWPYVSLMTHDFYLLHCHRTGIHMIINKQEAWLYTPAGRFYFTSFCDDFWVGDSRAPLMFSAIDHAMYSCVSRDPTVRIKVKQSSDEQQREWLSDFLEGLIFQLAISVGFSHEFDSFLLIGNRFRTREGWDLFPFSRAKMPYIMEPHESDGISQCIDRWLEDPDMAVNNSLYSVDFDHLMVWDVFPYATFFPEPSLNQLCRYYDNEYVRFVVVIPERNKMAVATMFGELRIIEQRNVVHCNPFQTSCFVFRCEAFEYNGAVCIPAISDRLLTIRLVSLPSHRLYHGEEEDCYADRAWKNRDKFGFRIFKMSDVDIGYANFVGDGYWSKEVSRRYYDVDPFAFDLTIEGVEPNPGPPMDYDFEESSSSRLPSLRRLIREDDDDEVDAVLSVVASHETVQGDISMSQLLADRVPEKYESGKMDKEVKTVMFKDLMRFFNLRILSERSAGVLRQSEFDDFCGDKFAGLEVQAMCVWSILHQDKVLNFIENDTDRDARIGLTKSWFVQMDSINVRTLEDLLTINRETIAFAVPECKFVPHNHSHYMWHGDKVVKKKEDVVEVCGHVVNMELDQLTKKIGRNISCVCADSPTLYYRALMSQQKLMNPVRDVTYSDVYIKVKSLAPLVDYPRVVDGFVARTVRDKPKFGRDRLKEDVVAQLCRVFAESSPNPSRMDESHLRTIYDMCPNYTSFVTIVGVYPDLDEMRKYEYGSAVFEAIVRLESRYADNNHYWFASTWRGVVSKCSGLKFLDNKETFIDHTHFQTELRSLEPVQVYTQLQHICLNLEKKYSVRSSDWDGTFQLSLEDKIKLFEVGIVGVGSATVAAMTGYYSAGKTHSITIEFVTEMLTTVATTLGLIESQAKILLSLIPVFLQQIVRVKTTHKKFVGSFEAEPTEVLPPLMVEDLDLQGVLASFAELEFGANIRSALEFLEFGTALSTDANSPWLKLTIDKMQGKNVPADVSKENYLKKYYVANKLVEYVSKYPVPKEVLSTITRLLSMITRECPTELKPFGLYLIRQVDRARNPSLFGLLREHGVLKGLRLLFQMHPIPSACLVAVGLTLSALVVGKIIGHVKSSYGSFEAERRMFNRPVAKIMGEMRKEFFISDPSVSVYLVDGEKGLVKPTPTIGKQMGQYRRTDTGVFVDTNHQWVVRKLRDDGSVRETVLDFPKFQDMMKKPSSDYEDAIGEGEFVRRLRGQMQLLNPDDKIGPGMAADYYNTRRKFYGLDGFEMELIRCGNCKQAGRDCACYTVDLGAERPKVINAYTKPTQVLKVDGGKVESNDSDIIKAKTNPLVAPTVVVGKSKFKQPAAVELDLKHSKIVWLDNVPVVKEELVAVQLPSISSKIRDMYPSFEIGEGAVFESEDDFLVKLLSLGSVVLGGWIQYKIFKYFIMKEVNAEICKKIEPRITIMPITELPSDQRIRAVNGFEIGGGFEMATNSPVFRSKHVSLETSIACESIQGDHYSWGLCTDKGLLVNKHTFAAAKRYDGMILRVGNNRVKLVHEDFDDPKVSTSHPTEDLVMIRASIPMAKRVTLRDFAGVEEAYKISQGTKVLMQIPDRGVSVNTVRNAFGEIHLFGGNVIHTNVDGSAIVDHDCSTLAGDCGIPVLLENGKICGIHFWGNKPHNGFLPLFTDVFRNWYMSLKNWDVGALGGPNIQ